MPASYIQIPTYDPTDPDQPVIENPAAGMARFRLDTSTIEIYNGTEWTTGSAITSRYIQVPQARNPGQYPINPPIGSMVFNESTQKIDVFNGRDWRPGVNVPLMRRIVDLPDWAEPDADDCVIVERIYTDSAGLAANRTYKTTITDLAYSDIFGEAIMFYIDQLTTDDIEEGVNNLYFTQGRARESIAAETQISVDGALGTLTYDAATGVMSYLGPTQAQVRACVDVDNLADPGFGSLTYDAATGVITYTAPTAGAIRSTISIGAGSTAGLTSLSYDAATGEFTYQAVTSDDVRGSFSTTEADQASYDSTTGVFSLPGANSDVTFNSVTVQDLNTDRLTFTGVGPVSLTSSTDLTLEAVGLIKIESLVTLPRLTLAELAALSYSPTGTVAYCTDPAVGDARPVHMTSTGWRDFSNGVIQ